MRIFQELTIKGELSAVERFIDEIESSLKGEWSRDKAMEEQVKALDTSPTWCFAFGGRQQDPAAYLWLAYREPGELYIPNIVPAGTEELSRKQYNRIVQAFYTEFAKEAARRAGVVAILGSDSVELEDLLSAETAQALQRFSALANKSTGSSHPLDKARWEKFLISAHVEKSALAPYELERWLVEEQEWPSNEATDLAVEYENAMSLLDAYDSRIQKT